MTYASVNGLQLYYETHGSGRPLVLLHGGLMAAAPDPAHFDEFTARTSAMVHEFPGWTDELRSLQVPTLLIFGDRDFAPLPDVVEMFDLLPDAQLAVLPGTTHMGVTRRPGEVLALITPFLDAC
jgi:pimeloyl-ACP methyl ester carboxylesterase